jgi:hypothetical protein
MLNSAGHAILQERKKLYARPIENNTGSLFRRYRFIALLQDGHAQEGQSAV